MHFCVWEDERWWTRGNHSFDVHRSYLEPVSCVLASWVSLGLTTGSDGILWLLDGGYSFPSWVSSGLTGSQCKAAIAADYDIFVYWWGRRCSISHQGLWSPEVSWARWKHPEIFTLMLGNKEGQDSEKRPVGRHCLVWGARARVTEDSWKVPRTTLGSSSWLKTEIREAEEVKKKRNSWPAHEQGLPAQLDSWWAHLWGH